MSHIPDQIRTDRVRLFILVKRKEGITREEFSTYWRNTHANLFMSLDISKTKVLGYEQAHTDSKWLQIAATAMGLPAPEWDGVVILDGESFETLFSIFESEEYQTILAPDEVNFINKSETRLLPVGLVSVID